MDVYLEAGIVHTNYSALCRRLQSIRWPSSSSVDCSRYYWEMGEILGRWMPVMCEAKLSSLSNDNLHAWLGGRVSKNKAEHVEGFVVSENREKTSEFLLYIYVKCNKLNNKQV